jgi:hypothetical protein
VEFCSRLLEEEKVAAVPGSAFGAEGYLRLSYATSDAIIAEMERLKKGFPAGIDYSIVYNPTEFIQPKNGSCAIPVCLKLVQIQGHDQRSRTLQASPSG